MLHSFKVKNYQSILNEQEIDFTTTKRYDDSVSKSFCANNYINNINLIVGGNGSGKTAILHALTFFFMFMQESEGAPIKKEHYFMEKHKLALRQPTTFELIFEQNKKLFKFELEINSKQEIAKETLYLKETSKFSYIYRISKNNLIDINPKKDMDFDIKKKIKKEFDLFQDRQTRASFFATLIRYELTDRIFGIKQISNLFRSNVAPLYRLENNKISNVLFCSNELKTNKKLLNKVASYVKKIDPGIDDLNFNDNNKYVLKDAKDSEDSEIVDLLNFKHKSKDKEFNLNFLQESEGTCAFIDKLILFLEVLEEGGLVILDEIDNSLHPILLTKLIGLFANQELNKKNAQLIFSTHQPLLMKDRLKNQIYLVEKRNLATEIYRLDEIPGVDNIENFPKKYLSGEYGGIPQIGVF